MQSPNLSRKFRAFIRTLTFALLYASTVFARGGIVLGGGGSSFGGGGGGGFISTTPAFGGPCEETTELYDHGEYVGIVTKPCEDFSDATVRRNRGRAEERAKFLKNRKWGLTQ